MKRSKFSFRLFFGLFFLILILGAVISSELVSYDYFPEFLHSPLAWIKVLTRMPLGLVHRSYPYYAEGPMWFGLLLIAVNTGLQTVLVYFALDAYRKSRKK